MATFKIFDTLRELLDFSSDKYPHNKAFSFIGGASYTYSQFANKAEELSSLLSSFGFGAGVKVGILSQNMPNWPVSFFCAVAYGRVAVPLLPEFSEKEVSSIIEHSETEVLFVSKKMYSKISEESREKLGLIIEMDHFNVLKSPAHSEFAADREPETEDLASIIYTSGTTGNSKGVMLSHKNLCAELYSSCRLRPGYSWDVWLSLLPLSHTYECSLGLILPMYSGSTVYFLDKAPTPTVLMAALKRVRPTTICSVPLIIEKIYRSSVLPQIQNNKITNALYKTTIGRKIINRSIGIKLKEKFGGRLRFFGIGGAKLDGEVERFLAEAKFPYSIGYGLTETAPLLAGAAPDNVKWQSTGPAAPGVELKISNPDPLTGEGEIIAKGENIMMGYYKNEEATALAFTSDGWFKTQDLGYLDSKGRLYIRGRLKNMILGPSGENIYPEDIESVINSHGMVADSLVMEKKGKLVAKIYFNQEKISKILAFKDELMENYREFEGFSALYNSKKEEVMTLVNEKIEQIKKEIYDYVNARVNKFSQISIVEVQEEQFEKTATLKIKRYLYQ
jgi:long-chain acyl-CoA synthetase